ncbi:MAG: GvpL/GvpF family gas vesicle protein [Nitrospirae bacterium]|nr:GvpL/GvpF family gas vesicle protein [Nitrospirota bacterium]
MEGKYIYGIIESTEGKVFNSDREVYAIPHQDISAVVSDSEIVDYNTLTKDIVARHLLRHQQVMEGIMDSCTVIPVKLGTYALNTQEVEELLFGGYGAFKRAFRELGNRIEMEVTAVCSDLDSAIKEIGNGREVKELKEQLMSRPGGTSLEERIKIGRFIKNLWDRERERLASEIEDNLSEAALTEAEPELFLKRHALADEGMITNAAFLIDRGKRSEFERRLDALSELYAGKINFRCVGPLPAYSFYTAEVRKVCIEEVNQAKKILCLKSDALTENSVKKAYRNLAPLYHPDVNQGRPEAESRFTEINRAYKLLIEYCLLKQSGGITGTAQDFIAVRMGR